MSDISAQEERDRLAEEWLCARYGCDWYIGEGTVAEWRAAYAAVDAESAKSARVVPSGKPGSEQ